MRPVSLKHLSLHEGAPDIQYSCHSSHLQKKIIIKIIITIEIMASYEHSFFLF
ncbi:hypothetical protein HanIR_Chr10g0466481 [Helianthus annuus]|nr:hypothetical protein HanIR_Chr10g0466481 [Helianthus annuus]